MHGVLGRPIVRGVLGGLFGVGLGLLLWHAYTDHVAFHTMLNYLNQTAGKINKLP